MQPPSLDHHITSAAEMETLYQQHDFDHQLASCHREAVEREKTETELMHEIFCCKKEIFRFMDANGDEVALTTIYTKKNGSKNLIISRLRIANDVYDLKLQ